MKMTVEVNGQPALLREVAPAREERYEPAPRMKATLGAALQLAFDRREIVGIVQPAKSIRCARSDLRGDILVRCSSLATFRYVEEDACETCGHTQKAAHDELCIAHMALHVADSERQTEMEIVQPSDDEPIAAGGKKRLALPSASA